MNQPVSSIIAIMLPASRLSKNVSNSLTTVFNLASASFLLETHSQSLNSIEDDSLPFQQYFQPVGNGPNISQFKLTASASVIRKRYVALGDCPSRDFCGLLSIASI